MPQGGSAGAAQSASRKRGTLNGAASSGPVLRAVDATFSDAGEVLVAPFSLELAAAQSARLACADERAAKIAARMAAGIVKPTNGTLLIGEFDPRIQPVQAKRLVGYVPVRGDFRSAPCDATCAAGRREAVELHAALFEVAPAVAQQRVDATLEAAGSIDAETFALALALMRPVALLVLERPSLALSECIRGIGLRAAVLATTLAVEAPLPVAVQR